MPFRYDNEQPDNLARQLYATADADPPAAEYRRSSKRRTSAVPLEVEANGKTLVATIVNVGPDSLCVKVREDIHATTIRVRQACKDDAPWCSAEVIHCTETLGGYKLGLKVKDGAVI